MPKSFTPSFKDIQKDIERYLKSEGKYEKNEHGQGVYRGYDEALELMFRLYMKEEAFVPLVSHFRKWNTELAYNNFLLTISAALLKAKNWPLLKELWAAVIAKRKKNYNDHLKYRKLIPEKITESKLLKTRELLVEALKQLERYALQLKQKPDISDYMGMLERVQEGKKA